MGNGKTKQYLAPLSVEPSKRRVRREMSASLMSSTKWRTLFEAIENLDIDLQIIVKFIDSDDENRMSLPSLYAPHDFVDSFARGPFPLLDLEWIEFPFEAVHQRPNNIPAQIVPQNVAAVRSAIDGIGKVFPFEETQRGLRIIGHVRPIS